MRQLTLLKVCISTTAFLLSMCAYAQGTVTAALSRPIAVIVPFPPGGVTELEARLYSQKLSEVMGGHAVLVDFKPGAGSTLGAAYVAKAAPDGNTLLVISGAFTIAPQLYKDLPYDAVKDFAPVSLMSTRATVLMANPSKPYKTSAEFITYAKAHPGEVNFATSGAGGAVHLFGAWLAQLANVKFTFIHYNGTGPLLGDLFAGRVDVYPTTFSIALPFIKSGKLHPLGVSSAERSPLLPGMPTVAEQGVTGYDYSSWLGMVTTGGTPAVIVRRLSGDFAKVAKSPDIIKRMEADGSTMVGGTPEQFARHIGSELARWRKLVAENDIKLEQ